MAKKKITIQFDTALQAGTLTQQNLTSVICLAGLDNKVKVHPLTFPRTREVYGCEVKFDNSQLDVAGEQQLLSLILSVTGIIPGSWPAVEPLLVYALKNAGVSSTTPCFIGYEPLWLGVTAEYPSGGGLTYIGNRGRMDGIGLDVYPSTFDGRTVYGAGLGALMRGWTDANPPVHTSDSFNSSERGSSFINDEGHPYAVLKLWAGCRVINDTPEGVDIARPLAQMPGPAPANLPYNAPDTKLVFPANSLGIITILGEEITFTHSQITMNRPVPTVDPFGSEDYGTAALEFYIGVDNKLYPRYGLLCDAAGAYLPMFGPRAYDMATQLGAY